MPVISYQRARAIAAEWYSPSARGLVAFATMSMAPDRLMPVALSDTEREIAEAEDTGQAEHDIADLRRLQRYLHRECTVRDLI